MYFNKVRKKFHRSAQPQNFNILQVKTFADDLFSDIYFTDINFCGQFLLTA